MSIWVVMETEGGYKGENATNVEDVSLFANEKAARDWVKSMYDKVIANLEEAKKKGFGDYIKVVTPPDVIDNFYCDCCAWGAYEEDDDEIDWKLFIKECEVDQW